MDRNKKKVEYLKANKSAGITLIALVVTLVVLLILAGISITVLFGENGILKTAKDAKLETQLSIIEEQARIIYTDKLILKIPNGIKDKPTMEEIVSELRKQNYTIEQIRKSENVITGISLSKESISIGKEKTGTIQVTLISNESPYTYYVLVEDKYYKINFNNGAITIDRTPNDISNIKGEDTTSKTLTATSEETAIATVVTNTETNEITITAKNQAGIVTITVTYGEFTKTCRVKVCEVATSIELSSARARIAKDYTRWLKATAKPEETASQEFEWESNNKEVATVDNQGIITALKDGEAIITVKTTDGSQLSQECKVTVVGGTPLISTLGEDYQTGTKNRIAHDENGNLMTVPTGFKVLTDEGTNVTEGIVIQDRNFNEFVWIPIDSISTGTQNPAEDIRLGRYDVFTKKNINGNYVPFQDADNYKEWGGIGEGRNYEELAISSYGNATAKNLDEFITKTKENGGYYLGRYEASKGTDGKVESKSAEVWGANKQGNASDAAKAMYDENENYVSDLLNSYSWDTAIVFIQKFSGDTNYATRKPSEFSTGLQKTGISTDKK